ncbi:chemotaxis protein CheB [Rhizobium sp. PL01]|uniref:chemotaxis protein CheB n=1 Tax=Rhizobium sp. PL01 TaxID=3085631 RepID=UPI002980D31B|nr:chemotaxis protein CheB [Rhizobium sp. PL01]MDW5317498.1 CheR family methyltransferase [Rhizobium sp. PL01]
MTSANPTNGSGSSAKSGSVVLNSQILAEPASVFPIVAIGASAGGLEACRKLLSGVSSPSGMAFIFVQHLDPNHKSLIAELLKDNTKMKVMEARDDVVIERDHVYVIAPGTYLVVEDGLLRVVKATPPHGARLPFDALLKSLADYAGASAICIVLSGTGADGSAGLASIKQRGGLVIVQQPEEAAYDGMPRSAVMTNLADKILTLQEMPRAIADVAQKLTEAPQQAKSPGATKSMIVLSDIIALLRSKTALDFTSYKQGTLQRRVERRMGMNGVPSNDMDQYMAILEKDPDERENLAKDLLINVTNFFRDKQVFDTLNDTIIPDLVKAHKTDQPIRVWIAGCSSGEEAYSIAILFREELADTNSSVKLQLFASDVDEDAVATAREGLYPEAIKADISPDRLSRFFMKEDKGYRVVPEIRSNVVFTVQDVLADPPFSRIDLVSCRNLLIYLEPDAQAKAISLFHFALREGGILLLGSSETAGKVEGRFETISKSNRIYRHIGRSRPGDMMFSLNSADTARAPQRSGTQAAPVKPSALADICRQKVLEVFAPAAVLINQKNECLYTMGRIGQYLAVAPGYPTSDLLAMTPQALHTKLRSAIQRCSQQKTSITASGGEIDNGHGTVKRFTVHVEPIDHNNESLFLICFIDDPDIKKGKEAGITDDADVGRIEELELELESTRTELNGAISNLETSGQEQKAINEEALSFNEEYQSTNEELLTSKEELQSLNEELTALNGQLQETLERQRTTSNDLQNILYSTAVATLFLDADLNIRFFTPATKTLFNVIPSDIGRPLADLSSLAIDTTLLTDAKSVLVDHAPLEHKIEAKSGLWYMRRIMPYLDEDHAIEGVVITFVDVTEQRRTSEALRVAKKQADIANAAKSRFLAAASHDLRQPLQTLSLLQGLLVRKVKDEKAHELLTRFEDTLGAMSGMLNALLDINQIEAGIVRAEVTDFRIQTLLTLLRDELTLIAQSQSLEFRVVDCSLLVRTDPLLLEQMIRNLISNAFKYTRTGRVLVGCRRRGKSVSIEIWDTGIGIPAAELKSIFEEYHQIDNEARERGKGLGLGLSIVQRLSDLLGHRIDVKSRQAKGSVFAIEVDCLQSTGKMSDKKTPSKSILLPDQTARAGKILIVEDDTEIRSLLEQLLSDEGHTVLSVPDGPSALSLITSTRQTPDVILTDYNLPGGMNGVEIVTELRKIRKSEIPVIVLTGDISTKTLAHITSNSVIQLNKPITPKEVTASITRLLALQISREKPVLADIDGKKGKAQRHDKAVVYVVDDDDDLRRSLCELIEDHGISAQPYESSEAFLAHSHPEQGGCLLVDAYLPGMNGVALLQNVKQSGRQLGAIMITGNSDVQMAVDAMKAGASDFVEKPINHMDLLEIIDRAIDQSSDTTKRNTWVAKAVKQIASLTVRQKEIMELVLAGHPSKNIAADLDISQRTVENHRASIMTKTGSKSLPALARLALAASEAIQTAS